MVVRFLSLLLQVILLLSFTACSRNTKSNNEHQVMQPFTVEINRTTFPDYAFRSIILSKWYGSDGLLTEKELHNVKELAVTSKEIKSLKGIEFFTSLEKLDCSMNKLKTLDLSKLRKLKTLQCYDNHLEELDVSKNPKLEILYCGQNKLTSLNVSNNISLSLVSFEGNHINVKAMGQIIQCLPRTTSNSIHYFIICGHDKKIETNKWTTKNIRDIRAKGWIPYDMNGNEL